MNFPLYDTLYSQASETDLTEKEKIELIKDLSKIDTIGSELIYALIKSYQINNDKDVYKVPYEGISKKGECSFDLEKLPSKLKRILQNFVNKHFQKTMEDLMR